MNSKGENLAGDIETVLRFYEALGFENLPLTLPARASGNEGDDPRSVVGRTRRDRSGSPRSSPEKEKAMKSLGEEIGDCQRCKLSKGRTHIVFGEGNPDALIMFVGEGPGRDEDLQARPFVGEAGQLLTRLIERMGFARTDVYIGNIVKCRPPHNRDPEDEEIHACSQFIARQIEIISPRVLVCLGRIAAHTLTGTKIPITKLRGRFYEYKGVPLMPTFHPAYLLRNPKDKWLVWEDAQKVLQRLRSEGLSTEEL